LTVRVPSNYRGSPDLPDSVVIFSLDQFHRLLSYLLILYYLIQLPKTLVSGDQKTLAIYSVASVTGQTRFKGSVCMKQEDGIVILALPHFIGTFKWMPAVPRRSVVLAYTPTFEKLIPHLTRTGVSNQVILAFRAELLHFAAPKGGCSVNSGDQEHFGPSLGRAAGGWPVPFRDPVV
jgi:hypothetical protein